MSVQILVYLGLFLARLELWLLSSGATWQEFLQSLNGTMDNIMILTVAVCIHGAIIFAGISFFKYKSLQNSNDAKRHLQEFRSIIIIGIVALIQVFLPGYIPRLLLSLLFEYSWEAFEVDFGTGKNFSWHVSLGLCFLFTSVNSFAISVRIYKDFSKYRQTHSVIIPCY